MTREDTLPSCLRHNDMLFCGATSGESAIGSHPVPRHLMAEERNSRDQN
jgi:hypothetical protein